MGLTSAYAAGFRARTKVFRGNVTVNMLVFDGEYGSYTSVGQVKSFEMSDPYPSGGASVSTLKVAEDAIATASKLASCQFSVDGEFYKVTHRAEPLGNNKRLWRFTIVRTGDSETL